MVGHFTVVRLCAVYAKTSVCQRALYLRKKKTKNRNRTACVDLQLSLVRVFHAVPQGSVPQGVMAAATLYTAC